LPEPALVPRFDPIFNSIFNPFADALHADLHIYCSTRVYHAPARQFAHPPDGLSMMDSSGRGE
jgi:hypothetical protein